jgi:hypothetical protein
MGLWWLIAVVCAVWVIYDVFTKQKMKQNKKLLWTVAAIIFNVLTAIVYYFIVKRK